MNDVVGHTEADIDIVQDVVYENKSGLSLTLDILQPSKRNRAAVIFFNSGGFYSPIFVRKQASDASSRWMLFQETQENKIYDLGLKFSFTELLSAGFTVFDIRHRSGPQYRLDEIVDDSRRAVEFIKINAMKANKEIPGTIVAISASFTRDTNSPSINTSIMAQGDRFWIKRNNSLNFQGI